MEVELTQYKRPDGRKSIVHADLPEEYAKKAQKLTLSCELLTTGKIAIYARKHGEPEESEKLMLAYWNHIVFLLVHHSNSR